MMLPLIPINCFGAISVITTQFVDDMPCVKKAKDRDADGAGCAADLGGDTGAVTIGFTAASSYVFLPGLIQTLRHELPAVSLTLGELTTPQQVAALQAGQLDFGLLRSPVSLVGISTVRVFREALVVAVPTTHPFAGRMEVGVQDLVDETLITYPPVEGPYFHRLMTGLLHVAGVSPAGLQYVTQTHSILSLVGAGLGVAIVPESAGSRLPAGVALRTLKGAAGIHADLVLAWPSRATNPSCALVAQVATREQGAALHPEGDGHPLHPSDKQLSRG